MKDNITRRNFIKSASIVSAFSIIPSHVLGGMGITAPSDRINLGFIGTGRQARTLQKNFMRSGGMQITSACDVYATNLNHFTELVKSTYAEAHGQEKYKGCKAYADFRELLESPDVDAVVISTPDHWHGVQAVKAAEAGKDIYCEKPLTLTIKEGRAIANAVNKHKRVFQTGSMQRSAPEFRHAVELVRNGYIGEIETIKVSIGGPPEPYNLPGEPIPEGLDWEMWLGPNEYLPYNHELLPNPDDEFWAQWRRFKEVGGGAMTDWGAHMFDIAQWAMDMDKSGPVEIIPPDGKNFEYLTYRYHNGITMTHENFGKNNAIRFVGTEGQIDVQRRNLAPTPVTLKDQVIGRDEIQVYRSVDHYKDWLDAIRNRSTPICDAETGHRTSTVGTLGNIAYELGRPLKWNPKTEKFKGDSDANKRLGRKLKKEWSIRL
ncbi:MAG: Gfo/Idh/MocA family oxidoreductase [Balneolales bacterium]